VRRRVRAWGISLLAAGLMAGFAGAGSASAMASAAQVPDGGYPFVAKIQVGELRSCTGTLVDRRWVLSTWDCLQPTVWSGPAGVPRPSGPPPAPTTVLVGRTDLTKTAGHRYLATRVVPHQQRNLALVELSAPVTDVAPARVSANAPAVGEALRIAGYGRTATDWVPDRLHAGTFTVQSVDAGSIGVVGDPGGATLCKGDAGGPAFREVSGGAELVGISDTSWQKGCLGVGETRDGADEARVDDLGDWIRSTVAIEPSGLREPVTGDFNRDAYQDLIAADAAGILWLYPGTPTRNAYGQRVRMGSGWGDYRDFAAGRVNRDDYDDLITIQSSTGILWLYPGTATGGLFGPRVQIGSGWQDYRDVVLGNVNRDAYDDLLTVQDSTQKLFLYKGNAAGGTFDAGVQYGSGWGCCKQLALGRFTDDDYDDLMTADTTGKMRIYPGTTAGTQFGPGVDTGSGSGWNSASYLAAGQFDGTGLDGFLEVEASTGLTKLHRRTADGGWAAAVTPPGQPWATQPYELTKLATGELNRDGYTDTIGVDPAGVLWLYPGTAQGTFGPRVQIGAGWGGYRDLVIGRVNRDAYDDLITIESSTGILWLYPGTAAGGLFGPRAQIGSGWNNLRDLALGKVNRDPYDDLLTVDNATGRLLLYAGNATGGRFDAGIQYGSGWGCCQQVTLGRFNGDDYDDLLTVDTATGKLRVYPGTEAGTQFGAAVDPGAGTGWQNRTELTPFTLNGADRSGLYSLGGGALVLNEATPAGVNWNDPIRFGPRD
jgi:trypsin